MSRTLAVPLLGLAVVACHRDAPSAQAEAGPLVASAPTEAPKLAVLPARCQATGVGFAIDDGHRMDDLEIGDSIATPGGGIAVDVLHRTSAGRVAAVALVPAGAVSMQLRDLGPTLGDAPPPRVASRATDLVAVSYSLSRRPESRELAVYTLSPSGDVKATGSLAESRDDSLSFDVSSTLVVWDEARPGPAPTGVIRVAELAADGRPGPARNVSPIESDAEMPRIASSAGTTLVFWLDRKPEDGSTVDASTASEVTGEARAYSWLQVAAVDPHGTLTGPPRRLTSQTGHVSSYDIAVLPPAASRAEVLVVARDDGEAVDGSGGALLRVRVRADGQDPALAFATDGLGRGAPAFVDGSPPWLSWVSTGEEARLLSLDGAGAPTQLPSVEPAMNDGRPLAWVEQGHLMLAAMPGDDSAQLRVLSCVP
jgi:hypothetical protein